MTRSAKSSASGTEAIRKAFTQLLARAPDDEHAIQRFLEKHTELVPTPLLLNHGLHFNAVISKFPVSASLTSDFAYLTKSTVAWRLVLVELEAANKPLFTKRKNWVTESADLKDAMAQVRTWRDELKRSDLPLRSALGPLLQPLSMRDNRLDVAFVLVIGRDTDLRRNREHRDRLASYSADDGLTVLTYDSLLRGLEREGPKNILAVKGRRYRFKHLHTDPWHIFSYLTPADLEVTAGQLAQLRTAGYDMDSWLKGDLLIVDGKYPASQAVPRFRKLLGETQNLIRKK